MNSSTIGVISTPDGRSQRDLQLQQNFNCSRPNQTNQPIIGNGVSVLGFDIEERSVRDKQLLGNFSCSSRENYSEPQMIYPRSEKDMALLREFNSGACKETFQYQGSHQGQREKIARRDLSKESYGCPCGCPGKKCMCRNCPYCNCNRVENYCGSQIDSGQGFARLNFNPNNSSSNITYVPL